ncbi:MAG: phosphopantetheine-binding protein [Azoarcus sp.]|jgi:acyl carrier protein|nr:phosphopantetheine-binding protein [Azoarcus sp.]
MKIDKMDRDAIYALVSRLLAELFEIALEKISLEAHLYEDLDIDSIDAVDLAAEFRKQTGRQLTPDEFKRIRTVGDIVDAACASTKDA